MWTPLVAEKGLSGDDRGAMQGGGRMNVHVQGYGTSKHCKHRLCKAFLVIASRYLVSLFCPGNSFFFCGLRKYPSFLYALLVFNDQHAASRCHESSRSSGGKAVNKNNRTFTWSAAGECTMPLRISSPTCHKRAGSLDVRARSDAVITSILTNIHGQAGESSPVSCGRSTSCCCHFL
jgi:hypothetical protein